MDGILIIDDDKDQLFDIFGRDNKNLILRVNTTEAEALMKYDAFEHFRRFNEKYANNTPRVTTLEEFKSLINELYTLTETEVRSYDLDLDYRGYGSCKKTKNERNMFLFLFILWALLFSRWLGHNRMWFFERFYFYGIRIFGFYVLKLLQCFTLMILLHLWYFPSERYIYIEGRVLFDILLWFTLAVKHFSLGICLSLLYSFVKENAFDEDPHFDELYVLILVFIPVVYLVGLLFSFTLFYGIFYMYALMMLVIGWIIISIVIVKIIRYWGEDRRFDNDLMTYKRSIFATCFACTFIIVFYECIFSYIKADAPNSTDLMHEYRLMVNNEVLLLAVFTFLLRLFDKENVITYYLQIEGRNNDADVRDIVEAQGYDVFPRRGRNIKMTLPLPVLKYQKSNKVIKRFMSATKQGKKKNNKNYNKLDESKKFDMRDQDQHSTEDPHIFGTYQTPNGFVKWKVTDFRNSRNADSSVESVKINPLNLDNYLPANLFLDVYNRSTCYYLAKSSKLKFPTLVVNPEYYTDFEYEGIKNEKHSYETKDINYHALSLISKS